MNYKLAVTLTLIVGAFASAVALTNIIELTGPALAVFYGGLGFAGVAIWDNVVLRDLSTIREVSSGNVAYALVLAIPAIVWLAACIAAVG